VRSPIVRPLLFLSIALVLSAFAPSSDLATASRRATIVGTVMLTDADAIVWAGDGARVVLACEADGAPRTEVADERGAFRFPDVPIDSCSIEADVQGFVGQPLTVLTTARQAISVELRLGVEPLDVGVNVRRTR
jgi:hypothetical protein